ncbi:tyrosine-type recombinase/integrase [Streptomyces virginiae]|uniref:tyrosine-type recombinase/integrase n=1 Tax=Streptomyces virginiae TaxID=1961 RepID=UPI0036E8F17D
MEQFLRQRSAHHAAGSIRAYGSILRRLATSANKRVGSLRPADFEDFFYGPGGLAEKAGRGTLAGYRNRIKQFLSYCHRREWHRLGPEALLDGIDNRSGSQNRNRYRMTRAEIRRLIAAAEDPRDAALVWFVGCTGVRISEAIAMHVRDLSFAKGELYVTLPKTYEEVTYPLSSDLEGALRSWLTHYTEQVGTLKRSYRLFPPYHRVKFAPGGGLTKAGQYNPARPISDPGGDILHPMAERAGIELESGDGWHTLRRSFARILYDDAVHLGHDAALRIVQAALNHKSVKTTERYLGLTAERKQFVQMIKGKPFLTVDLDPGKIADLNERRAGRG